VVAVTGVEFGKVKIQVHVLWVVLCCVVSMLPPSSGYVRGPFTKFLESPYYSESELCGGAVTVSFSKYLLWQAMHFLQRSNHFTKTRCRPLNTSEFLASELHFRGWKSPEIAWGEIWTAWRMF
jgi:hypothetical protein